MKRFFIQYSAKKWIALIIACSFIGGILLVITSLLGPAKDLILFFLIGALIAGGFTTVVALMDKQFSIIKKDITKKMEANETELKAAIGIRPLTKYPIKVDPWHEGFAATAHFLQKLSYTILTQKPKLILECGSGSTTVLIASCLKLLSNNGLLISLDNESYYANQTRNRIEEEGLQQWANIIEAPIRNWTIDGEEWYWYDFNPDEALPGSLDLVIIDGPPGNIQPLSRYPAAPILREYLSDEYLFILEDGNREDETEIAERWAKLLNADKNLDEEGRGIWEIKPK